MTIANPIRPAPRKKMAGFFAVGACALVGYLAVAEFWGGGPIGRLDSDASCGRTSQQLKVYALLAVGANQMIETQQRALAKVTFACQGADGVVSIKEAADHASPSILRRRDGSKFDESKPLLDQATPEDIMWTKTPAEALADRGKAR